MNKLTSAVLTLLIAVTTFSSCNFAKFDRYPGTSLKEVPAQFQGLFFAKAEDNSVNKGKDTAWVQIGPNYYQELKGDKGLSKEVREKKMLGKDFLFTTYKEIHFIAVPEITDSLWTIFVLEPGKKGFTMLALLDRSAEKREESKSKKGDYAKYFIEKQRMEVTGKQSWYYVMDEEKLYKAYKKKIRKFAGIEFIRSK